MTEKHFQHALSDRLANVPHRVAMETRARQYPTYTPLPMIQLTADGFLSVQRLPDKDTSRMDGNKVVISAMILSVDKAE